MKPSSERNNPAWKLAGGEVLSAGRSNAEAKKQIMGMRLAVYNARAATDLALPGIAQLCQNHGIVSGRLSKYMKPLRIWQSLGAPKITSRA